MEGATMTVEKLARIGEETEKTLRAIDAFAARMAPLLKSLADSNARLLEIIAEQERRRQPSEEAPPTATPSSLD
jgi:hypothetical protein